MINSIPRRYSNCYGKSRNWSGPSSPWLLQHGERCRPAAGHYGWRRAGVLPAEEDSKELVGPFETNTERRKRKIRSEYEINKWPARILAQQLMATRGEIGEDNFRIRSDLNSNFKDMEKYF